MSTHPKPGKTIVLKDGRILGYEEYNYGTAQIPTFFVPGLPGCRLFNPFVFLSPLNQRLLILDRPGLGLSSDYHQRTFLNWAADVEEFLDYLQIPKVNVIGYSAGGPFAMVIHFEIGFNICFTS